MKKLLIFLFLISNLYSENIDFEKLENKIKPELISQIKNREDVEKPLYQYLLKFYTTEKKYEENVEKYYEENRSKTPLDLAILGSLETLKARDFTGNEVTRTIISLTPIGFVRVYYVNIGIDMLDDAVEKEGENLTIRTIRSLTYLNLPAIFSQFDKGFNDMKYLLKRYSSMKNSAFLKQEMILYYGGRYFFRNGQIDKAKELFLDASKVKNSPFSDISKEILKEIN